MHDDTTGRSVDSTPWPEARPPHLPDRLTALSPRLIPFLLLAAVQVVVGWQRWVGEGALDVAPSLAVLIADRLPGLAAILLGAALFWRHPQAHRTLPMVALGVALLATAELLRLASGPLGRLLPALSTGTEEYPFTTPFQVASFVVVSLVTVFGIVYLARGLRAARRSEDVVSVRGPAIILAAVSLVSTAIAAWTTVTAYDEMNGIVILVVTSGLITSLAFMLAWSSLLVVALGGWLAGERPRVGWLLVAIGAGILLANGVVVAVSVLLAIPAPGTSIAFQLLVVSYIVAWLALLLAFVVGLPSIRADPPAATTPDFGAG